MTTTTTPTETAPILETVLAELRQLRMLVETRLSAPAVGAKPLSIRTAAEYLGVSESFLRKATTDGRIRATRQGRRVLISPEELARIRAEGIGSAQDSAA